MQKDMHYYGTYAMARAAGLAPKVCQTIATAAEFVDDNGDRETIEFPDGGRLDFVPTAHHAADIKNIDRHDQRLIWVPFHFIPGNQGRTVSERFLCRKDSGIAREMIAAGREDEVEEIRDSISTIVPDPDVPPPQEGAARRKTVIDAGDDP